MNNIELKNLKDTLDAILHELTRLYAWWKTFKELFYKSPARYDFLMEVSSSTFAIFEDVLTDSVLITLAKLCDSVKSCGKENLCLEQICIIINNEDEQLSRKLAARLSTIREYCDSVITHRKRRLAHFDYRTHVEPEVLPRVSVRNIDSALRELEQFVHDAAGRLKNCTIAFEPDTWLNETDKFIERLKQAMRYEELRKEGRIDTSDIQQSKFFKV